MPFLQRRKLRLRPGLLVLLMIALAGLALYALLVELGWIAAEGPDVKLVDSESALTLFALAAGLTLSLEQHAQSVRPYLVYEREKTRASVMGLPPCENGYWRVSVRNAGRGLAVFMGAVYVCNQSRIFLPELRRKLQKKGLVERKDFVLRRVSPGFALGPGLDRAVAEIRWDALSAWPNLTLELEFESLTGIRYTREIHIGPPG